MLWFCALTQTESAVLSVSKSYIIEQPQLCMSGLPLLLDVSTNCMNERL